MKHYQEKLTLFLNHRRTSKVLPGVVGALLVFLLIQTYRKAYRDIGYDLTSYLLSAEAFLAGANPYQTESVFPYIYPLFLCVAMVPLAVIPYWLAVFMWFCLNLGALFYTAKLLLEILVPQVEAKKRLLLFCFSFLLLYQIFSNNFLNGQINPLILLLVTLFMYYYQQAKKGKATWFLAVAIITKLTPGVFLLYLLLKHDIKSILLVVGQCLVLGIVLPWLLAGNEIGAWYAYYLDIFLKPKLEGSSPDLGPVPFALTHFLNAVVPALPRILSFCLAALLVLLPMVYVQVVNRVILETDKKKNVLVFCLYLLAMLLISPMSEKHHLVHVYPSVMVILVTLFFGQHSRRKSDLWLLVVVVGLLFFGGLVPFGYLAALLLCYFFVLRSLLQQVAAPEVLRQ